MSKNQISLKQVASRLLPESVVDIIKIVDNIKLREFDLTLDLEERRYETIYAEGVK